MIKLCALALSALFVSSRGEGFLNSDSVCRFAEGHAGKNTASVRSRTEDSGEVVSTFSSYEVYDRSSVPPEVEFYHFITECGEKDVVHVETIIRVPLSTAGPATSTTEKLRFYETGGKNALVSADGTTVTRLNQLEDEGNAGVLTNRVLNDNEMFEVRLDRVTVKYDDTVGIGVTHHNPISTDYHKWMRCGSIILYDERIYEHGEVSKNNYGANLKNIKPGDRVGVMKKSNGDLHFFINDEDQGLAKSNVTYPVYGVLDVYGKAVQLSIIS